MLKESWVDHREAKLNRQLIQKGPFQEKNMKRKMVQDIGGLVHMEANLGRSDDPS